MKIYVFTNEDGEILGTIRPQPVQERPLHAPTFAPPSHALGTNIGGQYLYEVDLPPHCHRDLPPEELHRELAKLIPAKRKK
jgi:hypothetical protein